MNGDGPVLDRADETIASAPAAVGGTVHGGPCTPRKKNVSNASGFWWGR